MAAINIPTLVTDTKSYLPASNVLTDTELTRIATSVVTYQIPEDDDIYYSEALCKTLKAAAFLNKSKYVVDKAAIKEERVGGISVERFQGTGSKVWDEYIKTLPDVCPYLPGGGYSPSIAIGIFINPGDPVVVDDCPDESELTL